MKKTPLKCLICGKESGFDLCENCAGLMQDPEIRQYIYNTRYQQYNTDHGEVDSSFIKSFIEPGLQVLEIGAGAGHLSNVCMQFTDSLITTDFSLSMASRAKKHIRILKSASRMQNPVCHSETSRLIS